jgi:H+/Cl- antiporter ClcA
MGLVAFLMDILVNELAILRWESTEYVAKQNVGLGWLVLTLYSVFFLLISALLTVYFAPSAAGSGVAEAMGILNGVA